ncbi:MAG: MMPL family transporter [Bacteroidales bacterium]|nr:MMPL family transporter [Bacteroidales bacterium]
MMSKNYKRIFILFLLSAFIAGSVFVGLKRIEFEESISGILPASEENELIAEVIDSATFFDKMIFHIYLQDSSVIDPDILADIANQLIDSINKKYIPEYIQSIEGQAGPSVQFKILDIFYNYLPIYLNEDDYVRLDSIINHLDFNAQMKEFLKILNSPAGMMAGRYIFRDPFGLSSSQLKRLKDLQVDQNLILYRNHLITQDKKHLLFFLTPGETHNTGKNALFIADLNDLISNIKTGKKQVVNIDYIGALPIATANALRIKKDIRLTVTLAVIVIIILIYYFFRRKRILWIIMLPAVFGASVSLLYFAFFMNRVSVISLGIGSVLLGITVDYALHLLTHLKHHEDLTQSVKKVRVPVLMSGLTTAIAFLCLLLLSSPAMKQLGIFAAISVLSAALLSVFVLPFILPQKLFKLSLSSNTIIERLARYRSRNKSLIFLVILIGTIVMLYFSRFAEFEKDIEKSNYMPDNLAGNQKRLDEISAINKKKIYLLSTGNNLDEAVSQASEDLIRLKQLKSEGNLARFNGIQSVLIPENQQKESIEKWNEFWSKEKIDLLKSQISEAATKNNFKSNAFDAFFTHLEKNFQPIPVDSLSSLFSLFTENLCVSLKDKSVVITVLGIEGDIQKEHVTDAFINNENTLILDRKDFFVKIFNTIKADFDDLVKTTLLVVFIIILIFLGRSEMAIITFLPIVISWIWTLGIMGISGIKLNFFNIIICTLIFGLGIDYSIFITKGLIQKYRYGRDDLVSFKSSILISVFTTLSGLGVLLMAKHPALHSIASLATVGIISVVLISFTLQPLLFKFLVNSKSGKRPHPVTLSLFINSLLIFVPTIVTLILFNLLLLPLYILPIKMSAKRKILRDVTTFTCKIALNIHYSVRIKKENFDKTIFRKPSILVSNHQSMIDILIFLSISSNILIVTKDWVWKSPFLGMISRFCGHVNISKGYEEVLTDIKKRMNEGCSLLVFPEGTRTRDGKIKRFHKGGFYLAQRLKVPVQNFLIHGAWDVLPPEGFVINPGIITIRKIFSELIDDKDPRAYNTAAKKTCAKLREELSNLKTELETPYYFRHRLKANYLYKGPILENYIRIKLRMEKYYTPFHELIPDEGIITDVGCGYGPMTFMLSLCKPNCKFYAIDYDEEKIATAKNSGLNNYCNIQFEAAEATKYEYSISDIFIISDMLHYLTSENQHRLISKFADKLNQGGKILIRDSDSAMIKRHFWTRTSEFFSTRLGFNKISNPLEFTSKSYIEKIAIENNFSLEIVDNTKITSNLIYILSKNNG